MVEYKVTNNKEERYFKIEGDFVPGSKPVEIPTDSIKKEKIVAQFISACLNKRDIEIARDYLRLVSENNPTKANEALFVAALSTYFKCFQNSESRIALDENAFKKFSPSFSEEFEKFKMWRNKHYIHDENSMNQAFAFIPVAPMGHPEKLGGLPSVIWNSVQIDFIQEGKKLLSLMYETWKYAANRFDTLGNSIIQTCEVFSHEELLALPDVKAKLASFDSPEKKRE